MALQKYFVCLHIIILRCGAIMNRVDNSHVLVKDPGERAEFPCRVKDGETAYWLHNDQVLLAISENKRSPNDNKKRVYINNQYRNQRDLVIENIKLSDEGEYKCKSLKMSDLAQYQLFIRGPVKLDTISPSLVSANEFDDVILWCNASGKPDPEITWFAVTQFQNREEESEIGIEGPKLEIRNISRHCMSSYRCHASNKYLELVTVNASFQVHVEFKPTAVLSTSVNGMATNNSRIPAKIGDEVQIVCDITYFPPGSIMLYHVNSLLATTEEDQVSEESVANNYEFRSRSIHSSRKQFIMVFRLERPSSGRYTCVANNPHGNAKVSVWVDV